VFLCGLPGAGKSTVGAILARQLGAPFCDLDAEIVREASQPVHRIFADEGEGGFRVRERHALARVAGQGAGVIALGGGALEDVDNLALVLATGTLVWLDADDATLTARVQADGPALRPKLAAGPAAALAELRARRQATYMRAHLRLDTAGLAADDLAARIGAWLRA
jgi:shikimate kinase